MTDKRDNKSSSSATNDNNLLNGIFQFGNQQLAGGVAVGGDHVDDLRNVRLPNFFRSDPNLWFVQAELIFDCNRVRGERQRAGAVVSILDYEIIQTISDLLTAAPPVPALYTAIKERIITNFAVSPEKELRAVLRGEIFADGKPSLILSKIRHLSRGRCSRSKNRDKSKNRWDRSRGKSKDRKNSDQCYYHFKFGENADFCKPPCSYKKKLDSKQKQKSDSEN